MYEMHVHIIRSVWERRPLDRDGEAGSIDFRYGEAVGYVFSWMSGTEMPLDRVGRAGGLNFSEFN